MAFNAPPEVWILDNDQNSIALCESVLSSKFELKIMGDFAEFKRHWLTRSLHSHRLVLADPKAATGLKFSPDEISPDEIVDPRFMLIVSHVDDAQLIRFYLSSGVRDYLLKPLRPGELAAKVERAFDGLLDTDPLESVMVSGLRMNDLTQRESQILRVFLKKKAWKATRQEIHSAVWKNLYVSRKTLDVHLFNIRRKLRLQGYDILHEDQAFELIRLNYTGASENLALKTSGGSNGTP